MRISILALMILTAGLFFSGSARADEKNLLAFSTGYYDLFDDKDAASFVLEYRMKNFHWWKISPIVGVMATSDSAVYGYAGLGADFFISNRFILNPNFAVGAYKNGDGKDLGHGLEFRSGLEVDYQFDNLSRAGIGFHHISNASLGDSNPGTEILSITYAIPVN